jgi:D-alanine-D-alanine ligase
MGKKRIGLVFGGRSGEHEVSLRSARGILEALDPDKYEVVLIAIDRQGQWLVGEPAAFRLGAAPALEGIRVRSAPDRVLAMLDVGRSPLLARDEREGRRPIDVLFPIVHGTFGEDGCLQGFFRLLDVPFVGSSVAASSLAMDKDLSKRLLREAGIPVARHVALRRDRAASLSFAEVSRYLGRPLFVKPANLGSSVGIAKVNDAREYGEAIEEAFRYDRKVVVEEFVEGREIECSVLGNAKPVASVPGEILPRREFYTYEAKYLDDEGAELRVPAPIDETAAERIRETAIAAFRALDGEGLARVDFFLRPDGSCVVNEVNTLPGFTSISMYPKLWEASGLPFRELLDRLIELAEERHREESRLAREYGPAAADSPVSLHPEARG